MAENLLIPPYRSSVSWRGALSRAISVGNTSEMEYTTAYDVFPMRVPLETVQIGNWKYVSSELDDIELLFELESSNLIVSTNVRGTGDGVPASFTIHSVSAVDLSLVNVVPGSLESMVARLIVETDSKIGYRVKQSSTLLSDGTPPSNVEEQKLDIELVKMTASVHESGPLRDILLFLKCNYSADSSIDPSYVRPKSANNSMEPELSEQRKEQQDTGTPNLTFVEWLPYWVSYIPVMMYSKRVRRWLQFFIFIYSVFTVIWAMWQLYRHVNVFRYLVGPFIDMLRFYLSFLVELFDWAFKVFTDLWHTYLSPLNVLRTILFTPVLNLLLRLRSVFGPLKAALGALKAALGPLVRVINNLLHNSGLWNMIGACYNLGATLFRTVGWTIFSISNVLFKPFYILWRYLVTSRYVLVSLDFQRVQISWAFNLTLNSIKSILRGLLHLVGYQLREQKIKKAMKTGSALVSGGTPVSSPTHKGIVRRNTGTMPKLYSSPVTKPL